MWAAWVVPYDTPLLLVGDESTIEAARALIRVGLDDVQGFLRGRYVGMGGAGLPVAQTAQITPRQLQRQLADRDAPLVLDVRTDDEWREGHLPGALHIMGGYLPAARRRGPAGSAVGRHVRQRLPVHVAASVLERAGFTDITNPDRRHEGLEGRGPRDARRNPRGGAGQPESPMTPQWLAGLALTGLVGASLGLLGAGGSIIMVPVLVYVVGMEPHAAVPLSLVIVGATSLVSVLVRSPGRRDPLGHGAHSSVVAALGGSYLAAGSPRSCQGRCCCSRLGCCCRGRLSHVARPRTRAKHRRTVSGDPADAGRGSVVGVFTGFLGVGGGFLIVPALVRVGGLGMCQAIRTSLVVIAMSSVAGLGAHLRHGSGLSAAVAVPLMLAACGGTGDGCAGSPRPHRRCLGAASPAS